MLGASTPAYETVRQRGGVHAQRTLLDSKRILKEYLAWCYWQKAAAKAMQDLKYFRDQETQPRWRARLPPERRESGDALRR